MVLEWAVGVAVEGGARVLGLALLWTPAVGAVGRRPVCAVLGPVVPSGGCEGSVRTVSSLEGVSGLHRCVEDAVGSRGVISLPPPRCPCSEVAHAFHTGLRTCDSGVPAGVSSSFLGNSGSSPSPLSLHCLWALVAS